MGGLLGRKHPTPTPLSFQTLTLQIHTQIRKNTQNTHTKNQHTLIRKRCLLRFLPNSSACRDASMVRNRAPRTPNSSTLSSLGLASWGINRSQNAASSSPVLNVATLNAFNRPSAASFLAASSVLTNSARARMSSMSSSSSFSLASSRAWSSSLNSFSAPKRRMLDSSSWGGFGYEGV